MDLSSSDQSDWSLSTQSSLWPPSSSFWETDFVSYTDNGKKPYLFKAILPAELCNPDEVAAAFRRLQSSSTSWLEDTGVRARVYVEEQREDDLALRALGSEFESDETLLSFMQRITGAERFSLVLNNFERASPLLAGGLGEFIQSMFRVRGVPIGGCEQVLFAGNYSGTAFGVHEGFEHAFLCHLGPGVKDFYCWPRETYLEMTHGSRAPTFGDYQWMLPRGQKFEMEPGDVLYLPALVYHVGRQTDFSTAIAIPLYTYPYQRFIARVLLPGLSASVPFDEEGMSEHVLYENGARVVDQKLSDLALNLLFKWRDRDLSRLLQYRWHRLTSNGCWEIPEKYTFAPFEECGLKQSLNIVQGSVLRVIKPYKICSERGLDCAPSELRVFLRSTSVVVPYQENLPKLFDELNAGKEIVLNSTDNLVLAFRCISQTAGLALIPKP